jgi:2'-5' RNA ligase
VPLEPTPSLEFTVDEVTLYRSFLGPAGARYEALGAASLV